MSGKPLSVHSQAAGRLASIIEEKPGLTAKDIATTAGYSLSYTMNLLQALSRHRKAKPVPHGVLRGWYPGEQADALLKAWADAKRRVGPAEGSPMSPPTCRQRIIAMAGEEGGASRDRMRLELGLEPSSIGRHCPVMVRQGRLFKSARPGCWLRWFDTAERAAEWAARPEVIPGESAGVRNPDWSKPLRRAGTNHKEVMAVRRITRAAAREAKKEAAALAKVASEQRRAEKKAERTASLVPIGERMRSVAKQPGKAPPLLAGSEKHQKPCAGASKRKWHEAPVNLNGKATDMRGAVDYSRAKVTRCPSIGYDPRYQLPPNTRVQGGFASAGIGRYLA